GPTRRAPPSTSSGAPSPAVDGAIARRGVTGSHWPMSAEVAASWRSYLSGDGSQARFRTLEARHALRHPPQVGRAPGLPIGAPQPGVGAGVADRAHNRTAPRAARGARGAALRGIPRRRARPHLDARTDR